ncbi:MAG TPA: precorrin-8X methylmutase [Devosia sp.]|nr:precorrin-8X methylmutase [Devosia sp.]
MTLFDRYIAVDWSAANERRTGKDSIWIAERGADGEQVSLNPSTRDEATSLLIERIGQARAAGERVMAGFDFVFGYPRGTARAIAGKAGWRALWDTIGAAIHDSAENKSNRFEAAAGLNRTLDLAHFWGHPPHHRYTSLQPTRPTHGYRHIAEHRLAETYARGPQPVWKLSGAGSVGSQTLLGIPRLQQIRAAFPEARVWPFETAFESELGALALVEIYPSMFPLSGMVEPKDREQVEVSVRRFAELDAAGLLREFLSAPGVLLPGQKRDVLEEEGWIAGVGHEHLLRAPLPTYLRDPDAIYRQSFATIEREADLAAFTGPMRDVAIRMIHACGMVDLAADIRVGGDPVAAAREALAGGAPILCDCEAVRAAIIGRYIAGNDILVTLNDPAVPELAAAEATTRSAAAVALWRPRLAGAVVVIGNAPTALFRLLEVLAGGGPKPPAIIATPVGFVGAAESKAALAAEAHGVPYITVQGRRGGSAIAAAALNAIAKGGRR